MEVNSECISALKQAALTLSAVCRGHAAFSAEASSTELMLCGKSS